MQSLQRIRLSVTRRSFDLTCLLRLQTQIHYGETFENLRFDILLTPHNRTTSECESIKRLGNIEIFRPSQYISFN